MVVIEGIPALGLNYQRIGDMRIEHAKHSQPSKQIEPDEPAGKGRVRSVRMVHRQGEYLAQKTGGYSHAAALSMRCGSKVLPVGPTQGGSVNPEESLKNECLPSLAVEVRREPGNSGSNPECPAQFDGDQVRIRYQGQTWGTGDEALPSAIPNNEEVVARLHRPAQTGVIAETEGFTIVLGEVGQD